MPSSVDRKLAAILSADVVGYSRLMAEDEGLEAAIALLGEQSFEHTTLREICYRAEGPSR